MNLLGLMEKHGKKIIGRCGANETLAKSTKKKLSYLSVAAGFGFLLQKTTRVGGVFMATRTYVFCVANNLHSIYM